METRRVRLLIAIVLAAASVAAEAACTFSIVGNDVFFDGCNVHIRDGSGDTVGPVNGLGNLIVGYAANSSGTGSHNIVVGDGHTYSSYAGIVTGFQNSLTGEEAGIIGGQGNTASGDYAAICGGFTNLASGDWSSVPGGYGNWATGPYSTASGGVFARATGAISAVNGGFFNTASGLYSTVSGGANRVADATFEWCAGSLCEPN